MKKGHRRTNSQTITLACQVQEKPLSKKELAQEYHYNPIQPTSLSHKNTFPTIESLIQKSQHNITERILYIQNLQQPTSQQNTLSEFSFGKGLNYKLNNFKLAMNSIPEVPKSNESTSLQGQNKLEILEKQLYFTHQPYKTKQFSNEDKKQHKAIKFSNTKHMKTSSAVTGNNKKISKVQSTQKPKPQTKPNEIKSLYQSRDHTHNPLKRPKLEYQLSTTKRNTANLVKQTYLGQNMSKKITVQSYLNNMILNENKKKKKKPQ